MVCIYLLCIYLLLMLKRIIQNNNLDLLAYKEFYRVLLHLSISSRCSNDCSKRISNVLDVYACSFSGCMLSLLRNTWGHVLHTGASVQCLCRDSETDGLWLGPQCSCPVGACAEMWSGTRCPRPAQERSCHHAPSFSDAGSSEHPAGKETMLPQPQARPPTVHRPTVLKS